MKTIVIEATPCPSCGKPMPAGALAGLCPACLLAQGADTDAGDAAAAAGGRFVAPTIEEVAKLFPQLEILALLGAGGMGAVYKARQPALDRFVALKILPATGPQGVNFEERFNREARALAKLSHPNIVAVHEFGNAAGLHYFLMEFVDGANLRQLERAGRLAPREALQIIPQICDALQYAHDEGVVHRDIKPENVLLDRKGRVKIADFGLAKIMGREGESARLTLEGQVMGTPHYMAPEQVERPLTVDHRADIYSLGVVFYEMLTGDLPLGKFSPPSRKFQLDVRLDDVVFRALENDPARRYQKVSEVKTQVENITGTPPPLSSAATVPEKKFIQWAGFNVAFERDGVRKLNWKGTLKAFAIIFGIITIGAGVMSLFTGRSLFGWAGVVGLKSVEVRLLIAAGIVAWGVWRTMRPKHAVARPPQTPQGTVILPPEQFSRKAVVGALWVPVFCLAAVIAYLSLPFSLTGVVADQPALSLTGWRVLLAVIVLLPGLTAPFGTTILGWLAVRDIRRARGRIGGLPLAVFDGLFFPLLALDAVLVAAWSEGVRFIESEWTPIPDNWGSLNLLLVIAKVLLCLMVDFFIVRRVWRAVQLGGGARVEPWWSTKQGAISIAVACTLIIFLVSERPASSSFGKSQAQQIAKRESKTGRLVVNLPGRGKVELLAIGEPDAAPKGWWLPDGKPITTATFEVRGAVGTPGEAGAQKDLLFRVSDLPGDVSHLGTEVDPGASGGSGGQVFRDGKPLNAAWQARFAWEPKVRAATVRMGFGLAPWRTIATDSVVQQSGTQQRRPTDPRWQVNFQRPPYGSKDNAHVAVVFGPPSRLWTHRVVAVDTNGVEHTHYSAEGTPLDKATLWTYTWQNLPLPTVQEFRLQVRPVHWVEFRDIALRPKRPVPPPSPVRFGPVQEQTFSELIDFDTGKTSGFPPARRGAHPFEGLGESVLWMQENGFDAAAGAGELHVANMEFVALDDTGWDTLTAPQVMERLHRGSVYAPRNLKPLKEGQFPANFAFRTREHGAGILQLVGFADGKSEATVRYKLVSKPTAE